LFNQKDV
jgi:26S proteasome regulatory subunit T4